MRDTAKPLTEEELDGIEGRLDTERISAYSCTSCGAVNHLPIDTRNDHVTFEIPRLVAEIRRLGALVHDAYRAVEEQDQRSAGQVLERLKTEVDRG